MSLGIEASRVANAVEAAAPAATATGNIAARLLKGDYAEATRLYRAAVVAHLSEKGSIGSTETQAADLLAALGADGPTQARVLGAFSVD